MLLPEFGSAHSQSFAEFHPRYGRLSITTTFTEGSTLGEGWRSVKDRQQSSIADGRYLWRAPDADTPQRWYVVECQAGRYSAKHTFPSALLGHSVKFVFIFFFFHLNFVWFVPTLCRPTCSIFGTIIKVFAINIRFCSFHCISSVVPSSRPCSVTYSCEYQNSSSSWYIFIWYNTCNLFPVQGQSRAASNNPHGSPSPLSRQSSRPPRWDIIFVSIVNTLWDNPVWTCLMLVMLREILETYVLQCWILMFVFEHVDNALWELVWFMVFVRYVISVMIMWYLLFVWME
jgi:hypothetical protein